jgi:hypothetical protein
MIEYWSVVGHACTDGTFCGDLFRVVDSKIRDHAKLKNLHELLCGPAKQRLRLSRWEVCDINRIFGKLEKDSQAVEDLQVLAAAWKGKNPAPVEHPLEVRALLGLCCIDHEVAGRYLTATVDEILEQSGKMPVFDLSRQDAEALHRFFSADGVKAALEATEAKAWIPPTLGAGLGVLLALAGSVIKVVVGGPKAVQCSAGHTRNERPMKAVYQHLSPPFVDSLAFQLFSKPRIEDLDL